MSELGVWLRMLVGALPIGLERLGRAAVGSPAGWSWLPPAVPWLVAAGATIGTGAMTLSMAAIARDFPFLATFGAGLLAGIVALVLVSFPSGRLAIRMTYRILLVVVAACGGAAAVAAWLTDAIIDAPLVAAIVAGLVIGLVVLVWRLQIARSAQVAATTIGFVPAVAWSLIILALVPAVQAGSEIIIARATVSAFVERAVGFSSPLIDIRGLALLQPLPAEAPFDPELGPMPGSFHWFVIRDELTDTRMGLVRTPVDPLALQRREIVGRVRDDIDTDAALAALAARGIEVPDAVPSSAIQALAPDEASSAGNVTAVDSVGDLAAVSPGTLVRLTVDLPGDAVAACVLADACQARRLALGIGPWLHLAHDPTGGQPVIVQLAYPPSVAPLHVFGRQERDPGAVARLLDGPQVRVILGWARILRGAVVDHDPKLPVDRLWIGPLLFVTFAVLLLVGRWVGYPIFRSTPLAPPRWVPDDGQKVASIRAIASGRLSPPGRSPLELVDVPVRLDRFGGETRLAVNEADDELVVTVPRALGALSGMEAGELRYLMSRRPTLRVGWYGSLVQLVFEDAADRDAAAALLRASV